MRRAVVGAAIAVLSVAGVACGDPSGGGGDGAKSLTALQAAAAAVDEAGSSRIEMTMTMDAGVRVTATMEGSFAYEPQRGEATVTMEAPDAPPGTPGLEGTTRMITDGTDVYMKGALSATYGGDGKTWGRLDMTGMPGVSTQVNQDPSQYLDFLRAAGREPEEVGTELVRGTETTHYATEMEFGDLLAQGRDLEEYAEQLEELGADVGPVAVEAWIADDGLPRRLSIDMEVTGVPGLPDEEMNMQVTVELYDYGVEVDVNPPKKFEELTPPVTG